MSVSTFSKMSCRFCRKEVSLLGPQFKWTYYCHNCSDLIKVDKPPKLVLHTLRTGAIVRASVVFTLNKIQYKAVWVFSNNFMQSEFFILYDVNGKDILHCSSEQHPITPTNLIEKIQKYLVFI